jgi:hypothetical protein
MRFWDNKFIVIEFPEDEMGEFKSEESRRLDRMIAQALQPLKEQFERFNTEFAEIARAHTLRAKPQPANVLMAEIPVSKATRGLRIANLDLARRIKGLRLEAKKHGAELSFSEAKEIALGEGFKEE